MNVYMKEKTRVFCQNSFDDLDDNIGIVMPILTECDVDEDFTEGIEKVGDTIPILIILDREDQIPGRFSHGPKHLDGQILDR